VAGTVGDAALLLAAGDPAYVAAALHRVRTDDRLRAFLVEEGHRRVAALSGDALSQQVVAAVASVAGAPA
jgi:hypothetical protein